MQIAMLTREYPPAVYGGAGVHVDYLGRCLRSLVDLDVHCMGEPRPGATAHAEDNPPGANAALRVFGADLSMAAGASGADLVHSHTWYANLAGHLSKLLYDIPHVLTAHSLEPLRPWKAEQLGGGYRLSSWAERTAYETADTVIAVSSAMRQDIFDYYPDCDPYKISVVYNGIDTDEYQPDHNTDTLAKLGVDPSRPYACFVGRITRQKGVPHLLRAAARFDQEIQLVLLAGAPDTPELARETAELVDGLKASRSGVFWVEEMLPRKDVIQVLTHATVFCCPSVYEPQGIVNLEAMACETAVVASAVGGIPEVVDNRTTGLLVPYDENEPAAFEEAFADTVNRVAADPAMAERFGRAGRERAIEKFGWPAIAERTVEVYRSLL